MYSIKDIEAQPEFYKIALKNRNDQPEKIDEILKLNISRKQLISSVENANAEIKKISKLVGDKKKNKEDATDLMNQVSTIKINIESEDQKLQEVAAKLDELIAYIPNTPSSVVPVGSDESHNKVLRTWGEIPQFKFEALDHYDIGTNLGLLDFETASKITGSRFAIYKGAFARLERALINFMIDHHLDQGYLEIIPPFMVHSKSMFGTGNLPKFKDEAFKIENFDWYLIPTAEVPVTNLKRESIFEAKELPLKYVSYTPCFRSEAGSYGKDTRGLIRMHQFNKVEMVNIVHPSQSVEAHQQMITNAENILKKLELPHRSLHLCTGDMGFSSTSTIDLEVWLPAQTKYREISSISNCGEFQARRCDMRFRDADGKLVYPHTLNGSGLAVGRTLVAILENYQQADGSVLVPKILHQYMGGITKISKN